MLGGGEGEGWEGGRLSEWERERQSLFEERGEEVGTMERGREEGWFDFGKLEEDRNGQREERWERIRGARYNKWYGRIKGEGIPGYLKKEWAEKRWSRVARYRMGEEVREGRYWGGEEERICRICGRQEETWEHVWEKCGRWGARGSWQEIVETVLREEGQGEEWIRKLENFRSGDSGEEKEGEGERVVENERRNGRNENE